MFFNAVNDKLYFFLEEPAPLYFSVQIEPERTQCKLYHVRYRDKFGVEFIVTTLFHLHWKLEHEGRVGEQQLLTPPGLGRRLI